MYLTLLNYNFLQVTPFFSFWHLNRQKMRRLKLKLPLTFIKWTNKYNNENKGQRGVGQASLLRMRRWLICQPLNHFWGLVKPPLSLPTDFKGDQTILSVIRTLVSTFPLLSLFDFLKKKKKNVVFTLINFRDKQDISWKN